MAGGAEIPNIAALPAIARLGACESARGPDADQHVKLLIQFAVTLGRLFTLKNNTRLPRYLRVVADPPFEVVRGGSRKTSFTWSSLSTTTTKLS